MPQIQRPGFQPNPQIQALNKVIEAIRGRGVLPTPWGFHEPGVTAGAGVEAGLQGAGEVLADPRNMWIGLGPVAMAARPMGWGAEVLRRYKLLGGTPETLRHTLQQRGMEPDVRNTITMMFSGATDLAAPPHFGTYTAGRLQNDLFEHGGKALQSANRYDDLRKLALYKEKLPSSLLIERPQPTMESGAKGNAAYDAVSRQVGRMLDQPGFGFKKSSYGPEPLADYGGFESPEEARRFSADRIENIMSQLLGPNAYPNTRR